MSCGQNHDLYFSVNYFLKFGHGIEKVKADVASINGAERTQQKLSDIDDDEINCDRNRPLPF